MPIGRGALTSLRGEPGLMFELGAGALLRDGSALRGMLVDGRSIPPDMLPGEGRGTLFRELISGPAERELSGRMVG